MSPGPYTTRERLLTEGFQSSDHSALHGLARPEAGAQGPDTRIARPGQRSQGDLLHRRLHLLFADLDRTGQDRCPSLQLWAPLRTSPGRLSLRLGREPAPLSSWCLLLLPCPRAQGDHAPLQNEDLDNPRPAPSTRLL